MKLELQNTVESLNNLAVILYPTDTVWGLGCDATSEVAIDKIYKIKKRDESKSLIILVDSVQMLRHYIEDIPRKARLILQETSKPTTIIYSNPKGLADNLVAQDNTVAIRIVQDEFCKQLIKKFGRPIVSTSANISKRPTPNSFEEIELPILNAVDYIVNLHHNKMMTTPSRIIRILKGGALEVIRE